VVLLAAVRLLRPKQWTKNLLVFAALVFTGSWNDEGALRASLLAFFTLCLASSAVYALNDVLDAELDRKHPKKRLRPVASGAIGKGTAAAIAALCALGAGALAWGLGWPFAAGIGFYWLLQVGYNAWFKAIPILDVFVVATGFVLRAVLGAVAIDVRISGWLLFCTGALALMLAFAKRRHEFRDRGEDRAGTRPSLSGYTQAALDALVIFSAGAAALSFGVYAIESETARRHPALILTLPCVLYGVMRYLYLVFGRESGGEPETVLLTDPHIVLAVVAFLGLALYAMTGAEVPFLPGRSA
jgi:4-hydroxybenzoate polyprenyltransferase